MIGHKRLGALVRDLYATVNEQENMFPGRHFTPDGHMVGSLGECLVADAYGLALLPASNKGFDALAPDGREVEIKATQSGSVAFRSEPAHAIVIRILKNGSFEEIYNGPGSLVWQQFAGKALPSNGQFQISLTRLRRLVETVPESARLPRLRASGNEPA